MMPLFHALTSLQCNANWQQRLKCMYWDTDRTGSDWVLSHTRMNTARRCRWDIAVMCCATFHDCFQERLCHVHVSQRRGQCALLT